MPTDIPLVLSFQSLSGDTDRMPHDCHMLTGVTAGALTLNWPWIKKLSTFFFLLFYTIDSYFAFALVLPPITRISGHIPYMLASRLRPVIGCRGHVNEQHVIAAGKKTNTDRDP